VIGCEDCLQNDLQCEWKKSLPVVFWNLFPNRWVFFNQFLHTYYTFLSTLDYKFLFNYLQIWQSYAILSTTTQRMFTFSLDVWLLSLLTEQMTSLLTSCHIRHVSWHYKSVYFIVTCHRQRSTKLSTTYANVWTRAFWTFCALLCELVVALNMA